MFLGGLLSAMADRLAILALAGRPYCLRTWELCEEEDFTSSFYGIRRGWF